jgi:hypothetical protein
VPGVVVPGVVVPGVVVPGVVVPGVVVPGVVEPGVVPGLVVAPPALSSSSPPHAASNVGSDRPAAPSAPDRQRN